MISLQRLLVPLDGSQMGESVLPAVAHFASAFRAEVTLLHILERHAPAAVHGDRHLQALPEATAYLEEMAAGLQEQGIRVHYHAHDAPEGDVARSIAAHAEEMGADLIVLCTHGHGGVPELLFGSIAQRVLHRGARPVLLIRPGPVGADPFTSGQTVLVPLDGTTAAEVAVEPAAQVAATLGLSIHLVMVVGTRETMKRGRLPTSGMLPSATRAALEIERMDAASYLEEVAATIATPTSRATTEVRRGDASSALVEEASEPGVALIVIATHGRAGLQAVWAASVTAQLLARTRAPVLLLRMIEERA